MKKIFLGIVSSCALLTIMHIAFAAIPEYNPDSSYKPGDVVSNNGGYYECYEKNGTNQCNFGGDYEPGVGIYSERTWKDLSNPSTPINSTIVIYTGSLSEYPGKPVLMTEPQTNYTGEYMLDWELDLQAIPGHTVKLEENGRFVDTVVGKTTEYFYRGQFIIKGRTDGTYEYAIYICNYEGTKEKCTKGNTVKIKVSGVAGNSSNTSTIHTDTATSIVKKSDIPHIKVLQVDNSLFNYEEKMEERVISTIAKNRLSKSQIQLIVAKLASWTNFLETENFKGNLAGTEKRNYFILRMIKEKFEKYD